MDIEMKVLSKIKKWNGNPPNDNLETEKKIPDLFLWPSK